MSPVVTCRLSCLFSIHFPYQMQGCPWNRWKKLEYQDLFFLRMFTTVTVKEVPFNLNIPLLVVFLSLWQIIFEYP